MADKSCDKTNTNHDNFNNGTSAPSTLPWDIQPYSLDAAIETSNLLQDSSAFLNFLESLEIEKQIPYDAVQQTCLEDDKTASEDDKTASEDHKAANEDVASTVQYDVENQKDQSCLAEGKLQDSDGHKIENEKQTSPTQLAKNEPSNANKYSYVNASVEISNDKSPSPTKPTYWYPFPQQNQYDYGDSAKVESVFDQIFGTNDVCSSSEVKNQQAKSNDSNDRIPLFATSVCPVDSKDSYEKSNCVSSSYGIYNAIDNPMPVNYQIEQQCGLSSTIVNESASTGVTKSQENLRTTKDFAIPIDHYPADKVTAAKKKISRKSTKKTLSENHKQKLTPSKVKGCRKRSPITSSKRSMRSLHHLTNAREYDTYYHPGNQATICLDQAEMRPLSTEYDRPTSSYNPITLEANVTDNDVRDFNCYSHDSTYHADDICSQQNSTRSVSSFTSPAEAFVSSPTYPTKNFADDGQIYNSSNHCHQCFLHCPVEAIFSRYDGSSKLLQDFLKDLAKSGRKNKNSNNKGKDTLKIRQEFPYANEPKRNRTAVNDVFHHTHGRNLISSDNSLGVSQKDARITSTASSTQSGKVGNTSMYDSRDEKFVDQKKIISNQSSKVKREPLQSDYGNDDTQSNWQISSDRFPKMVTSSQEINKSNTGSISYPRISLKSMLAHHKNAVAQRRLDADRKLKDSKQNRSQLLTWP